MLGARKRKQGFTLVELIVVITILAILGTIGFVSLQGYSVSARDSVRLSDMNVIVKYIELSKLRNGDLPPISNPHPIVFTGGVNGDGTIWNLGTFGHESVVGNNQLSAAPVDPLTGSEYAYATTTTSGEYQIGAILERSSSLSLEGVSDEAVAANELAGFSTTVVKGSYNGKFITYTEDVSETRYVYVLGVPSLILSEVYSGLSLSQIHLGNLFAYPGTKVAPASYSGSVKAFDKPSLGLTINTENNPSGNQEIIFQSDSSTLGTGSGKLSLISNLKNYYGASPVASSSSFEELVNIDPDQNLSASISVVNDYLTAAVGGLGGELIGVIQTDIAPFIALEQQIAESGGGEEVVVVVDPETTPPPEPEPQPEPEPEPTPDPVIVTDANCYDSNNIGTVGDPSWTGCANMLIVDRAMLLAAGDINGGVDKEIVHNSVSYTFGDSANNVFTGQVTNMSFVFTNGVEANSNPNFNADISYWDTSNVTLMTGMFSKLTSFNQPLTNFDTSNVTNMRKMFFEASAFNQPVNHFDVSLVSGFKKMFSGASVFNQDLDNWHTSSATVMSYMFENATAFNGLMTNFDTSNVFAPAYMFYGASSFNQSLASFDTTAYTSMEGMFYGASSFNQNLTNFDTPLVTNMRDLFHDATVFNGDISNFDTSSVKFMDGMFFYAEAFNQPLTHFNTASVTDMNSMFRGASSFDRSLSSFNTANVTDMNNMFNNATSFDRSLSSFNTSSVTNMSFMFNDADAFNQSLSHFDTSSVTNMGNMFFGCDLFNQNISNWNTSSVTNMSNMFMGTSAFNQNLSGWNVSNVTSSTNFAYLANAGFASHKWPNF